jgi:DNA-binding CsgD family transcriptional regulator
MNAVVVEASTAMMELLDHRDGLALINGRLVASLPAEQQTLQWLLEGRKPKGRDWAAHGEEMLIRLSRFDSDQPYLVKVAACRLPPGMPRLNSVVVLDPAALPEVPTSVWQVLYKLTPAEARVAGSLGRGKELKAIAEDSGTAFDTVRRQLRSVFEKTGFHRQSDLVRLFTNLSGMFQKRTRH